MNSGSQEGALLLAFGMLKWDPAGGGRTLQVGKREPETLRIHSADRDGAGKHPHKKKHRENVKLSVLATQEVLLNSLKHRYPLPAN